MPIYKVTSPHPVVSGKFKDFEVLASVASAHDDNGEGARPSDEGHADRGQNIKTMSIEQEVSSPPEAPQETEKKKVLHRKESVVVREVREQLRREAELAAEHGLLVSKTLPSSEDSSPMKVNILAATEKNGDKDGYSGRTVADDAGSLRAAEEQQTLVALRSTEVHYTTKITGTDGESRKPSKSGANRILLELQDQAAREEELWRRWKDGGWQFEAHQKDEKLDQRWSGNGTHPKVDVELDVVDRGLEGHHSSPPGVFAEAPDDKVELRSETSSKGKEGSKLPAVHRRQSSKVQPFEDVELIQSEVHVQYKPQNETSIDREMRIQREREEALYLARGIQVPVGRLEVEVEVMRPRLVEEGGSSALSASSLELSMKKFAESRLRSELEREKKREIDLLKEGKIKVLSEQRTSEAVPYVVAISQEKEELRELSRSRSSERMTSKDVSSKEMASVEMALKELASLKMASIEKASQDMISIEKTLKEMALKEMDSREMNAIELALKDMASRKMASIEVAPKEMASIEKALKQMALKEMASQEIDSMENASKKMASKEMASKELASGNMASMEKALKEMALKEIDSMEKASKEMASIEKALKDMASKEMASKEVVLKETARKEHLKPVYMELQGDQVDEGKNTQKMKLDQTFNYAKSEKDLEATGSVERFGRRPKATAKSPNSYTSDDVRKILLTAAEQRIEEEIEEANKREAELREQRRHHVTSGFPRQPESEDGRRNNAHAPNYASQKEAGQSSPPPTRDEHRHDDDVAEVHVTLDSVNYGDDRHQQPADGHGGSRRESRRLALIDQWERGIIQAEDHSDQ